VSSKRLYLVERNKYRFVFNGLYVLYARLTLSYSTLRYPDIIEIWSIFFPHPRPRHRLFSRTLAVTSTDIFHVALCIPSERDLLRAIRFPHRPTAFVVNSYCCSKALHSRDRPVLVRLVFFSPRLNGTLKPKLPNTNAPGSEIHRHAVTAIHVMITGQKLLLLLLQFFPPVIRVCRHVGF
jgi:hypothetical protein